MEELLKALLDLRIAIGELQAALEDIDKAVNRLMKKECGIVDGNPEN